MAYQDKTGFSSTVHLLMSEFGANVFVPLEDIAGKMLGISINTAKRKAGSNSLPFPAIRLSESQKSPYFVDIRKLAEYVDKTCKSADEEWLKAQAA